MLRKRKKKKHAHRDFDVFGIRSQYWNAVNQYLDGKSIDYLQMDYNKGQKNDKTSLLLSSVVLGEFKKKKRRDWSHAIF